MSSQTTITTDDEIRSERPTLAEALQWARDAEAGEYLVRYDDDDTLDDMSDPGSRCGYDDSELADVEQVLRARGLTLTADDEGLGAREVRS